jgi:hypothetical protein
MKKLVLLLALFAFTSCEKDEDFTCDCNWVKDPARFDTGGGSFEVGGGFNASTIKDCNRGGEMDSRGYELRCK